MSNNNSYGKICRDAKSTREDVSIIAPGGIISSLTQTALPDVKSNVTLALDSLMRQTDTKAETQGAKIASPEVPEAIRAFWWSVQTTSETPGTRVVAHGASADQASRADRRFLSLALRAPWASDVPDPIFKSSGCMVA
ncbi:hypothetical protein Q9L58_008223 [Maublancomyces gigas]|uniref:Uncharacterized protein n=1 Tax=Discina gigas TaxID=1032678 RepID=A0ABR3GAN9_9PEZI